jgi:hypothetical protein
MFLGLLCAELVQDELGKVLRECLSIQVFPRLSIVPPHHNLTYRDTAGTRPL